MVQVVPEPLLYFSTSVARSCFNGIIAKNIYTLKYERGDRATTAATEALYNKLENARVRGDLIMTTPSSLKSLMLKFAELQLLLSGSMASKDAVHHATGTMAIECFPSGHLLDEFGDEMEWKQNKTDFQNNFLKVRGVKVYSSSMVEQNASTNGNPGVLLGEDGSSGNSFIRFEIETEFGIPDVENNPSHGEMQYEIWFGDHTVFNTPGAGPWLNVKACAANKEYGGGFFDRGKVTIKLITEDFLNMILPSGKGLCYFVRLFDKKNGFNDSKVRTLVPPLGESGVSDGGVKENFQDASFYLGQCLLMFQNQGMLLLDEVDLIMHPLRSELNFPIGPKLQIQPAPLRWDLVLHIMDAVFYASTRILSSSSDSFQGQGGQPILDKLVKVVEKGHREKTILQSPHLVVVDVNYYHTEIKPIIAKWILIWLKSRFKFSSSVTDEIILKYICPSDSKEHKFAVQAIEGKCNSISMQMLNLSADWLRAYLVHVRDTMNILKGLASLLFLWFSGWGMIVY